MTLLSRRHAAETGREDFLRPPRVILFVVDMRTEYGTLFETTEGGRGSMKFMSVREFRVNTGTMRRDVDRDEEVVLTANGQPFAIVSAVNPESFDKELRAIRGARAKVALERVRESAARSGTAEMPMATLDTIVRGIRRAKRTA